MFDIKNTYRTLDLNKLNGRKHSIISSERALQSITPVVWSESVISGMRKVIITKKK